LGHDLAVRLALRRECEWVRGGGPGPCSGTGNIDVTPIILLAQLTKRLLESALEGKLTNQLGYDQNLEPKIIPSAMTPARDRRPAEIDGSAPP
jgi:hypothetical protein